ncbi:hypothetical protein [Halosegnis marinus]|uniref:hypothetical protein n=1 Tax=Halosegnis marinus TaxID=3034023 RepID=UPI003616642F
MPVVREAVLDGLRPQLGVTLGVRQQGVDEVLQRGDLRGAAVGVARREVVEPLAYLPNVAFRLGVVGVRLDAVQGVAELQYRGSRR